MSEGYPRTLIELEHRFGSEEACAAYLTALRWPDGWKCPRCAGSQAWAVRRNRWRCDQCRYEMSVTAGTIFQDSPVPLTIWFQAMWQVTSQKNGMSALGLQRVLGFGSYKTAWAMLHKLRRARNLPGRPGRRCSWPADGEQGVDCGGGRGKRQGDRADSHAAHSRRFGPQSGWLCGRVRGARQRGAYRRMVGVRTLARARLHSPGHVSTRA